jgi:sugar lactone lactonase YvrE
MWSGFRIAMGGAQEYFGVKPDLATYSKACANGMPLAILTGRTDVMSLFDNEVFSFTTFGGETLSLAASMATIEFMETHKVPEVLAKKGAFMQDSYNQLAQDLGMDQITAYPYKASANPVLQTDKTIVLSSTPGAGPRHISFSKNGKLLYAIEELTGTVTVFQFEKGKVNKLQTIATHPDDFKGQPGSADIHLSPDGKYLYVSNRGSENNIAKLEVLENGLLNTKSIHYFSTKGSKPRNFTISNDGKWLLVANQDTDNIVVFKIDPATGDLKDTGNQIKVSMPVCLVLF